MSDIVELECSCGTVKGNLKVVSGEFFHVECLCCDCQSFAKHLNNEDKILDKYGASELFQTYPSNMQITEGNDNIVCVQLKEKSLFMWYTKCCNMPLGNTMTSSNIPFVGVSVKLMKFADEQEKLKVLGPLIMKAFGKYSIGEMPKDAHAKFPLTFMPKIIAFMAKGVMKKKYQPSPFFNGKEPVAKADVLS